MLYCYLFRKTKTIIIDQYTRVAIYAVYFRLRYKRVEKNVFVVTVNCSIKHAIIKRKFDRFFRIRVKDSL